MGLSGGLSPARMWPLMKDLDPLARDFILFCAGRCHGQWPALYDEMCWVAGRRLFRNMGYAELGRIGLSLGLQDLDNTFSIIEELIGGSFPAADNQQIAS